MSSLGLESPMAGGTLVGIFTGLDGRSGTANRYLWRFQRSLLRRLFHLSSSQKSGDAGPLPGKPELSSPGTVLGPSRQRWFFPTPWVWAAANGRANNSHVVPGDNGADTSSEV